jgi:hypothetical protein
MLLQRTVPVAIKFIGPLVTLTLGLLGVLGVDKDAVTRRLRAIIADPSDFRILQNAMRAHVSQFVWSVSPFRVIPLQDSHSNISSQQHHIFRIIKAR